LLRDEDTVAFRSEGSRMGIANGRRSSSSSIGEAACWNEESPFSGAGSSSSMMMTASSSSWRRPSSTLGCSLSNLEQIMDEEEDEEEDEGGEEDEDDEELTEEEDEDVEEGNNAAANSVSLFIRDGVDPLQQTSSQSDTPVFATEDFEAVYKLGKHVRFVIVVACFLRLTEQNYQHFIAHQHTIHHRSHFEYPTHSSAKGRRPW